MGLFGPGYVWLTPDVPSAAAAQQAVNKHGLDPNLLVGFRSLYFSPLFTAGWARATAAWKSMGPSDCANPLFTVPPSAFTKDPDPVFAFAYDAAVALVLAMKSAASSTPSDHATLLSTLRAQAFDGASGPVRFDGGSSNNTASPGERAIAGLDLVVFQWNRDDGGKLAPQALDAISLQGDRWVRRNVAPDVERRWLGGQSGDPPIDVVAAANAAREAANAGRETRTSALATASGVCMGLLLLLLSAVGVRHVYRQRRKNARIIQTYKRSLDAKIEMAIESTSEVPHSAVLISAMDFMRLGELRPYEELRDRGMLQMHDKLAEASKAPQHTIFFSHRESRTARARAALPSSHALRVWWPPSVANAALSLSTHAPVHMHCAEWTSRRHPDPCGKQYATMVAAIGAVTKAKVWDVRHVWIWCDYCSIPQRAYGLQKLAIQSLTGFASVAHAFVIVAPSLTENGVVRDVRTYNQRMWCRAENLAFSLRNGTEEMWVATGPTESECVVQADDVEFLKSNLRVFQGEATAERDKLSLVVPILGLYAELYATAIHLTRRGRAAPIAGALLMSAEPEPAKVTVAPTTSVLNMVVRDQPATAKSPSLVLHHSTSSMSTDVTEESPATPPRSLRRRSSVGEVVQRILAAPLAPSAGSNGDQLKRQRSRRSTNLFVSAGSMQQLKLILGDGTGDERVRLEEELFPRYITLGAPPAGLGSFRSFRAGKDGKERVELFGPLIQMMQKRLHTDNELCEKLVAQAKEHKKRSFIPIELVFRFARRWREVARTRAVARAATPACAPPYATTGPETEERDAITNAGSVEAQREHRL